MTKIGKLLERALLQRWVFPACARHGELVSAERIDPGVDVKAAAFQEQVRELVNQENRALLLVAENEQKHITQMVRSGFGLTYEELAALLTSLSELAFVNVCRRSLGQPPLPIPSVPTTEELKTYLSAQADVYPGQWWLPHSIVLQSDEHWWWKKPATP